MTPDDAGAAAARLLDERRHALAEAIVARHYERRPELARRYGPEGRSHCRRDAGDHLAYLAAALAAAAPPLFAEYVAWAKVMLAARGIPAEDLAEHLRIMQEVLGHALPPAPGAAAASVIDAGLAALPRLPATLATLMPDNDALPMGGLARDYLGALLQGELQRASALVLGAADRGASVRDLYLHVFQRSQHEVGRLWQMNRISVAQEHYCTAATQTVMSQLYPRLFAGPRNGRVLVAACVAGDLHEIGARMVADLLELEGWDTYYLGANVPAADLVGLLRERRASVLALSVTMAFHLGAAARAIAAVRQSPIGGKVRIMVGGQPFNLAPQLCRQVGADATARDALEAVALADRLAGEATP